MATYIKAYVGNQALFATAGWTRPSDWLPLPTATANTVKGLYAVFNQAENYVTVLMVTSNNLAYNIDWGDGNTTTAASNTLITYNYNYSNAALNGTLSTRGYKQAIITISAATAGQTFTYCNIASKPTTPSFGGALSSGWLDLNVNLPNLTAGGAKLVIGSNLGMIHRLLERVNISSWGAINNTSEMFRNTISLASLNETEWNFSNIITVSSMFYNSGIRALNCENWDMSKVTSLTNIFRECSNLQSIKCSTWNLSACTAIDQAFMSCAALEDVNVSNWNVSNVQLFSYAFQGCRSLRNLNVANWNTLKATTINNMFESCSALTDLTTTSWTLPLCTNATGFINSCTNLRQVGPLDFSSVTTITAAAFAGNCYSLTKCNISGIKVSVLFTNCSMSATELDALYTSLATVSGQTITVTGNYGTTGDNPSIATAKGWTVTGS